MTGLFSSMWATNAGDALPPGTHPRFPTEVDNPEFFRTVDPSKLVAELRNDLKDLGLPTDGNKGPLQTRLQMSYLGCQRPEEEARLAKIWTKTLDVLREELRGRGLPVEGTVKELRRLLLLSELDAGAADVQSEMPQAATTQGLVGATLRGPANTNPNVATGAAAAPPHTHQPATNVGMGSAGPAQHVYHPVTTQGLRDQSGTGYRQHNPRLVDDCVYDVRDAIRGDAGAARRQPVTQYRHIGQGASAATHLQPTATQYRYIAQNTNGPSRQQPINQTLRPSSSVLPAHNGNRNPCPAPASNRPEFDFDIHDDQATASEVHRIAEEILDLSARLSNLMFLRGRE